jgi:hypothetical protein
VGDVRGLIDRLGVSPEQVSQQRRRMEASTPFFPGGSVARWVGKACDPGRLAAVDEVHTAFGAHRTIEIPFPEWVLAEDRAAAALFTVDEALAQLPACLR